MHSGGIWNNLELQRNRWSQCTSKACIVTVFETISNFRKIIENNVSNACIIWYDLELYETYENKDAYACNVTRFDTIFWLAEKILKAMKLNGAFLRFYARRLIVLPFLIF